MRHLLLLAALLTACAPQVHALNDLRSGPDPVISGKMALRLWVSALLAFVTN